MFHFQDVDEVLPTWSRGGLVRSCHVDPDFSPGCEHQFGGSEMLRIRLKSTFASWHFTAEQEMDHDMQTNGGTEFSSACEKSLDTEVFLSVMTLL